MEAATSRPIWPGDASSDSTANSGSARTVTWDPKPDTVWAAQSLTKSGCRQSPPDDGRMTRLRYADMELCMEKLPLSMTGGAWL